MPARETGETRQSAYRRTRRRHPRERRPRARSLGGAAPAAPLSRATPSVPSASSLSDYAGAQFRTRRAAEEGYRGNEDASSGISLRTRCTGTRRALEEAVQENAPAPRRAAHWSVQPVDLGKVPPLASSAPSLSPRTPRAASECAARSLGRSRRSRSRTTCARIHERRRVPSARGEGPPDEKNRRFRPRHEETLRSTSQDSSCSTENKSASERLRRQAGRRCRPRRRAARKENNRSQVRTKERGKKTLERHSRSRASDSRWTRIAADADDRVRHCA